MKIEKEKRVVAQMVGIYCRHKEGNKTLCEDCRKLLEYCFSRLDSCRYGEDKPSCRKCPIHCYNPLMRSRIREVMRYSMPRAFLMMPLEALRHM